MSADDRAVRLLTCPWGHVLTWPEAVQPYPTECPGKVATLPNGPWRYCGKTLTPKALVVPADAIEARDAEIAALRSVVRCFLIGNPEHISGGLTKDGGYKLWINGEKNYLSASEADAIERALTTKEQS